MSSKHPVTAATTDTVTIVSGRATPEQTSDYSGSGDPTLVQWRRRPEQTSDYSGSGDPTQWRRRPYESHAYPHCSSDSGSGIVGGVTNPRSFAAIDLPPSSPTKPIGDLDFDTKPSSTYQSLTNLPRSVVPHVEYTSMGTSYKVNEERQQASSCTKCSVCLWFFTILALLVGCGGVALGILDLLEDGSSGGSGSTISRLESQLTDSNAKIDILQSMITELQQNFTQTIETKSVEIQELSVQLNRVNESVEGLIAAPTQETPSTAEPVAISTVNLTTHCEYDEIQKCRILDTGLTPVDGADPDSYPNYSSCFTASVFIDMSDTFIQDVYCAVTDLRSERNPVVATLRRDADSGTFSCYCFVTAIETRLSVVDCSMFLKRCPSVVTVNN
jgi:hypothetical protein